MTLMWGYGWDMGWMWLFGVLTLVGIALLVVLAVRLFSAGSVRGEGPGSGLPAQDPSRSRQILDERFASGEITADQYREQIRVLREGA